MKLLQDMLIILKLPTGTNGAGLVSLLPIMCSVQGGTEPALHTIRASTDRDVCKRLRGPEAGMT